MVDSLLVAYIDESLKPVRPAQVHRAQEGLPIAHYAVAAVLMFEEETHVVREQVAELAHSLAKPLHYSSLSTAMRCEALARIGAMANWDALVVETERAVRVRNDRTMRDAVMAEAFTRLSCELGVEHVVVESRSSPSGAFAKLDRNDVDLAERLRDAAALPPSFWLEHRPKSESLLGLADLIVGARTDFVCGIDRTPWSLIAHRVEWASVAPRLRHPGNAEAPGR